MYVIDQNGQEGMGEKSVLVSCEGAEATEAEREKERVPFRYIIQVRKINRWGEDSLKHFLASILYVILMNLLKTMKSRWYHPVHTDEEITLL